MLLACRECHDYKHTLHTAGCNLILDSINKCLEWHSECQQTYSTTDSGLTHLLHDLSPDGGTYPTILFCKTSSSDP